MSTITDQILERLPISDKPLRKIVEATPGEIMQPFDDITFMRAFGAREVNGRALHLRLELAQIHRHGRQQVIHRANPRRRPRRRQPAHPMASQ